MGSFSHPHSRTDVFFGKHSPLLRWLMVEAAHFAVRWDPHWQVVYQNIAKRRGQSIAMVAVARKQLVVIWHLLAREVPYLYLNPSSFTRKLKEWAWTIGQENLLALNSRAFVAHQLQVTNLAIAVEGR